MIFEVLVTSICLVWGRLNHCKLGIEGHWDTESETFLLDLIGLNCAMWWKNLFNKYPSERKSWSECPGY